jgi:hypothetical protein
MRVRAPQAAHARQAPGFFAWIAYLFYVGGIAFTVCAVKIGAVGLPVRALFFFAAAGVLALSDPHAFLRDIHRARFVLLFIGAFAILGIVVSLFAGSGLGLIVRQLIEIHVQGSLITLLSFSLVRIMGVRSVVVAVILPIVLTSVIAIGQALGVDAAWQARASLGKWMHDPSMVQEFYVKRYRALGVSYSPVHLATQTCLAFAAFFCWRLHRNPDLLRKIDTPLIVMLFLCTGVCMASGNRSPILGFVAFFIVYCMIADPRRFVTALPVLLMGSVIAFEILTVLGHEGTRFARTDDSSAAGRSTLAKFGFWLVLERPLGYGLGFKSTDMWQSFAHEVIYDENPMSIRRWPPHNYFILILAKYGILSIPLILSILPRTKYGRIAWFAFLPYGVHVYFHNDGPLQSDNIIWVVITALIIVVERFAASQPPPIEKRRWTRTYRAQQAIGVGQT